MDENRATIRAMARDAYEKADGDWEDATRAFWKQLRENAALYGELVDALVNAEIRNLIRAVAHSKRAASIAPNRDAGSDFLSAEVERARVELLDYPLTGGIKLRDACRADLDAESDMREKLAQTNAINAAWLRSLHDALPDEKKRVEDVFSNEDLEAHRERCAASIAGPSST